MENMLFKYIFFFGHIFMCIKKERSIYLLRKVVCLFVYLFVTLKYPKAWCLPLPTTFFVPLENL